MSSCKAQQDLADHGGSETLWVLGALGQVRWASLVQLAHSALVTVFAPVVKMLPDRRGLIQQQTSD